ncbi:MAG: methionine synthase [Methanosarcinales archaeon]|nr:methionine synthase [ANME-2 cluster archaeon]MDW7775234.1 methionine synthase [Methanosarcinales archaeon]
MTPDITFDDIGSYPLPSGISREWITQAVASRKEDGRLFETIAHSMQQKIDAGVEVPTYPQFQDMNRQFLNIINDPKRTEEPLLVRESDAKILEMEAITALAGEYRARHGEALKVRVCTTGPVELYQHEFGGTSYSDVLLTMAKSIDRFLRNAINCSGDLEVVTVSIDEPSVGINPQIMHTDEDIIKALSIAGQTAKNSGIDAEIHLHSPLNYKLVCEVPSINIIGVESAANPSYLELIDRQDLTTSDTFLRVGIARTDIFGLTATLNEKYNTNVWKEPDRIKEVVTRMETPEVIAGRLSGIYGKFGDSIRYAGPDCGLGSWPTQDMARQLLNNTAKGMELFRQGQ